MVSLLIYPIDSHATFAKHPMKDAISGVTDGRGVRRSSGGPRGYRNDIFLPTHLLCKIKIQMGGGAMGDPWCEWGGGG